MSLRIGLLSCVALVLAGCGGGTDRSSTPPPLQDTPSNDPVSVGNNRAPVAVNDFVAVDTASISVDVLNNDSDIDGDTLSIEFTGRPSHGEARIDDNATAGFTGDDQIIYTPNSGFTGTDLFSYTIADGRDGRANGYVTVVVGSGGGLPAAAANRKPIANADSVSTTAPQSVTIDVLANDTDDDAEELALFGFSAPSNGSVSLDDNGTPDNASDDRLVYAPNAGFVGSDVLTYSITDGTDVSSGSVNIQVAQAGQAPILDGQVCGIVTLGPVNGASVSLYVLDDSGAAQGVAIAQTQTDPNGRWCAIVPDDRQLLLVEARGGVFPDPSDSRYERGGARLVFIANQLSLQTILPPDSDFSALTVFSNAVLLKSQTERSGSNFATVFEGNRAQAIQAFGLDVFTTDVADPVLPADDASEQARRYAMAVGAAATSLNQIAVDLDVAAPNYLLIDALIKDLSECRLNGRDQSGPIEVSVNGVSQTISDDIDLNLQILRFRNNLPDTYSGVPLLQVDQPVCEQVVDQPDTTPPVFTVLPANLNVQAGIGESVAIGADAIQRFLAAASATDDRDGAVPVVARLASGLALPAQFAPGSTAIEFTAIDSAGNAAIPVVRFVEVSEVGPPLAFPDAATTSEDTPVVVDVLANDLGQSVALAPATVQVDFNPDYGTVTVDALSGQVTYSPQVNRSGVDQFSYSVADAAGERSQPVVVTITVTPLNDTPVAVADVVTTRESESVIVSVLANDSDIEGGLDYGSLQIITPAQNGLATVDFVGGTIVYAPTPGFVGVDFFLYQVADSDGELSNEARVDIEVLEASAVANMAPVAVNDLVNVVEDTLASFDVLANDFDADGQIDASTLLVLQQPEVGSVTVTPSGIIEYVPATDYFGTDQFSYQVMDSEGLVSAPAFVFLSVEPENDAPVAQDDVAPGVENQVLRFSPLANDVDVDGLAGSQLEIVDPPQFGTAIWDPVSAEIVYTPDNGFNGTDTLSYRVEDSQGLFSQTAFIMLNVTGQNDAPVAVEDAFTVDNEQPTTLNVLANDSDIDSPLLDSAITIVVPPANGTVSYDSTFDRLRFTSQPLFVGTDSFTYRVSDPDGAQSNEVVVSLTIQSLDQPPVAMDDTISAQEQVPVSINVLGNDSDFNGDLEPDTVLIETQPASGSATVGIDGLITYVSDDNFSGQDSLQYSVADSRGERSNIATVAITVEDVNEPPVTIADFAVTDEAVPVTISVLDNDFDWETGLNPSSVVVPLQAQNGTTFVESSGSIRYTPAANFSGTDSFEYRVSDDTGLVSANATVTVTVNAVNDAPIATDDLVTTDEDTLVTFDPLINDVDDGAALDRATVVIVTGPTSGVATVDPVSGLISYTPNTDFFGNDLLAYRVSDDQGLESNIANVTLSINAVNDAPIATNDVASTDEDVSVVISVLANDSDIDGSLAPDSVVLVDLPLNGTATVDVSTGQITYLPVAEYFGVDSFTYQVSDDSGQISNIASVVVDIASVNDTPVANNDVAITDENVSLTINVAQNDDDADGAADIVSAQLVSQPASGTVVAGALPLEFVYTPNADFNGNDQFSYLIEDASGEVSNVATVSITIAPQPSNPVVLDRSAQVANDSSVDIRVLLGASDPEDDIVDSTVAIVSNATNGVTLVLPDGQVRYTPGVAYTGPDLFSFTVADATGLVSNIGTVTITVTAPLTGPVATDSTDTFVFSGVSPLIDLTPLVSDADGTVDFSTLAVANESVGTAVVQGSTGTVQFNLPIDFAGIATFEYSVLDNDGLSSNTAEVLVTVWPAEDQDLDGVGESIESKVGTDPDAADSVYVHIDPNTPSASPDGSSWDTAYPTFEAAVLDGKIESAPGNTVYVLMATNDSAATAGQEWQFSKTSNCDDIVIVGSLDPFVVTPRRYDNGSPRTKFETVLNGQRPVEIANCSNVQMFYTQVIGGNNVTNGGGISIANSEVLLNNVSVHSNMAEEAGGGIYVADGAGAPSILTIESSTVRDNVLNPPVDTDSRGGGLYVADAGSLTITESSFRHNDAPQNGNVTASSDGGGGGLFVDNTVVYISASKFASNRTEQCGGAIRAGGTQSMRIEHSYFSGNESRDWGGGLCIVNTDANFTIHNNLMTSNYADLGGAVYFGVADKTRLTNNTSTFNFADTEGGGMHLDTGADPVFSYNIAQFNLATGVGDDVSGGVGQLLGLDASYNFITSFFANFVGTDNSSASIEFSEGYYQQQSSPGVNYGAVDSNDPLFALNDRYTDSSGSTTDTGTLDAGFHYLEPTLGSVNAIQIVAPATLTDNAINQKLWIAPLVNGEFLGPGHRLYVRSSEPTVATHLYTYNDVVLDPLGADNSTQLTDLGNGYYEVLLDIPDNLDAFNLILYINSITTSSFNIQISN